MLRMQEEQKVAAGGQQHVHGILGSRAARFNAAQASAPVGAGAQGHTLKTFRAACSGRMR
jgi:hypothetical protein